MPSTLSRQPSLDSEKGNSREVQQQNDDEDYHQQVIQRELASYSKIEFQLNVWLPTSQPCLSSWPILTKPIPQGLRQGLLDYELTYPPSCSNQSDAGSQVERDLKLIMTVTSLISPYPGIGQILYTENKGYPPRVALHRIFSNFKQQTQDSPEAGTIHVLHINFRFPDEIEKLKPSPTVEDPLKLAIDTGVYLRRWNICSCPQDESTVAEIAQKYAAVFYTDEIHEPVAI